EICRVPLGDDFRAHFVTPYAVIHRGDLHGVLLAGARERPEITLRTSAEVVDYEQDADCVVAVLANGERVRGEALIGADGLWSKIREKVVGDGPPRVSGHSTYRSVIPTESMPEDLRWNAATLWAGPKCHIVHYPLSGWKFFNLVVTYHNDAPKPVAGKPVSREEVSRGFEHVCERARSIISHGTDWKLWVLCDREPVSNWTDGRVVLLGDAAHPMMQYMAQGACMAMEDSVALGDPLAGCGGSVEAAFAQYQADRCLRTARVQLQSRWIGEHIYHPEGAMPNCATPSCGRSRPKTGTIRWTGSMAGRQGARVRGGWNHHRCKLSPFSPVWKNSTTHCPARGRRGPSRACCARS
ncbi:MAG: FAD-dependent monooxygenase, partial [Parvibaculum sp.]